MQEKELIDESFYVLQSRWGTWRSYTKEDKELITALNKENCIAATQFYLKGSQEGWGESRTYDGTVGGKL